jgi:murein DD-endopeptidase MepM/ murein hydrolase activator NlpD
MRRYLAVLGAALGIACSGNPSAPAPQPTPTPAPTMLLWPVVGTVGTDWVINSYVDLDPTGGIRDYTGATGNNAKTSNGHLGIDIDSPNFRWMDGGVPIVVAAAGGVVTSLRDGEPDRNTACAGNSNFVHVLHADGMTALYYHLKKGSVAVSLGQQVSAGAVLGVAGSSGCSTAPHLHFELRNAATAVVDPFEKGLWASPPAYNLAATLMDWVITAGEMTVQQIKDPSLNITSIPVGSILGVGVSMAGGSPGDILSLVITDPTGAASDSPLMFTMAHRHSYWLWNRQLSPIPGVWTISFFVKGQLVKSQTVLAG